MKQKTQQAQKLPILSFFKEATLETCIVNLLLKRKKNTSVLHRGFISLLCTEQKVQHTCTHNSEETLPRAILITIRKLWLHPIPQPAGILGAGFSEFESQISPPSSKAQSRGKEEAYKPWV